MEGYVFVIVTVKVIFATFYLVSEHLLAQYNAIKMLHSRVKMILEYVKAVHKGTLLSTQPPIHPSTKPPIHPSFYLSIFSSIHWLFYPTFHPSIYPFNYPSHYFIPPSISCMHPSICSYNHPTIHPTLAAPCIHACISSSLHLTTNQISKQAQCPIHPFIHSISHIFYFISGEVPCNHEIMRDALSLCQRLPVMKTEMFKEGFYDVSIAEALTPHLWGLGFYSLTPHHM